MAGKRIYPIRQRFAVYESGKEDAYKPVKSFEDLADAAEYVAVMRVHNRPMIIRHQEKRQQNSGGWTTIEDDHNSIKPVKPPNR